MPKSTMDNVGLQIAEDNRKTIEKFLSDGIRKVNVTFSDGNQSTLRVFKSSNNLCYFHHRSRKWGSRIPLSQIIAVKPITSRKSDAQKWEDGWKKVIVRLEKSGLWEEIKSEIQVAISVGYERMNQAYKDYWSNDTSRQLDIFLDKYPELVKVNDEGNPYIDTSILWPYSRMPRVKKMCFSKYDNDQILATIKAAMDRKEKHSAYRRYKYDISFEYNPDRKRAWYSEEFKDCGNGHYYHALDSTHALFSEDD